ncbi:hypothetical protein MUB24_07620 [Lederbergia sp. NSJ-179]|uniref:hypothetical protein n=1 Tax=Lederbergia sp. NSJ-179 TaxID=2931402 RepID=UPI001FD16C28|nr:hypothetical protein [Lederbergia sp. NSJ-179]MCJ7840775.1 hypothetical protein [Lederbergia sp. NSJ-179]
MKLFNQARCVCFQNFRKWGANYRVWMIAIILILLTHYFTKEIIDFSREIDMKVSPWIFPFLFSQKYTKLLFLFPLLLLFCDAPFIDENQPYVIARSGRVPWSIGQISYIVISSAFYFVFLFILTIGINLFHMHFTLEWGKVLGTLANTNAAQVVGLKMFISGSITHYFSPLQAIWFSFLLSWLAGVFLGLLIYVVNSLSNTRILGVLAASFFLVLDATIIGRDYLYRFSPVSWSSIERIDIEGTTQMPSITYVYIGFAVLIIGMIISAIIVNRKQTINVLPPI